MIGKTLVPLVALILLGGCATGKSPMPEENMAAGISSGKFTGLSICMPSEAMRQRFYSMTDEHSEIYNNPEVELISGGRKVTMTYSEFEERMFNEK